MEKECERSECKSLFVPNKSNQKYCSQECCRIVNNEKAKRRYHLLKQYKGGEARVCSVKGCDTILSKYNDSNICNLHRNIMLRKRLREWGWNEDIAEML
jgi:hypothetical protein